MTADSNRLTSWPVEIQAPDIEPYRAGNTEVPFFWSFDGARPGPHVMVTALVHGNELCGARVLDRLLRAELRPARGRLTFGFCNVAAYAAFDAPLPDALIAEFEGGLEALRVEGVTGAARFAAGAG